MENRKLSLIIKDQKPVILPARDTVQRACRRMWQRRVGAVLVCSEGRRLAGIFTGRDAVRVLGEGRDPAHATLGECMTPDPATIAPECTAIDALRTMSDRGFRHLPVVDHGKILGIVSRGDFKGMELDRLEEETNLAERIW
jgi:CBS domain-containing protein